MRFLSALIPVSIAASVILGLFFDTNIASVLLAVGVGSMLSYLALNTIEEYICYDDCEIETYEEINKPYRKVS